MKIRALKELRFKTSRGEIFIKHGQVFKPSDPSDASELIKGGFAEPAELPPDKNAEIPGWQRPDRSCYVCHSTGSWVSIYGVILCSRCHPPACPEIVKEWLHGTA